MIVSNKNLNDYVQFINTLAAKEMEVIKLAQGPMGPAMGGGMPMDPAMMGGGGGMPRDPAMGGGRPLEPAMLGGGGMPMDPAMMGGGMPMDPAMMGGGPPVDPGMALGVPGNIDPAALGLIPPEEDPDKELLNKALDVSNKAMELAQAQTARIDELLGSMEGAVGEEATALPQEEIDALLSAKADAEQGLM